MLNAFAVLVSLLQVTVDLAINHRRVIGLCSLAATLAGLTIGSRRATFAHNLAALFVGAARNGSHAGLDIGVKRFRGRPRRRINLLVWVRRRKALGLASHHFPELGSFRHHALLGITGVPVAALRGLRLGQRLSEFIR